MIFGKTDPYLLSLILFCAVVAVIDVRSRKIPNFLTLPAILLGLVWNAYQGGLTGLGDSFLGLFIGLLLYGVLFAIGMMGAGDVKFLMALGAIGGFEFSWKVALLSIVVGGVFAFFVLLVKGELPSFLKRFYNTAISIFVKELQYVPFRANRNTTMPFGLAMAVAASLLLTSDYWGVLL